MTTEMQEIAESIHKLDEFSDKIYRSMEVGRQMPGWVRMADDLQMYSPESVVMVLTEQLKDIMGKRSEDMEHSDMYLGMTRFMIDVAVHRIHRFGAGPALAENLLAEIQGRIESWLDGFHPNVDQWSAANADKLKSELSRIWGTDALEAEYAKNEWERVMFVDKEPWPIILKH